MNDGRDIPQAALAWQFVRSRGPGGQNVNKVATAAQLTVDTRALGLTETVRRRLLQLAGSRATQDGRIQLHVDSTRSQLRNREIALQRLQDLLAQARIQPKRRKATRPSAAAKRARLDRKRKRSSVKQSRKAPGLGD